jgi:hypothetical protein
VTGTGLLTQQCDPFGIESSIRLMGGMYAEKFMGKHIWYCGRRAVSTHFFVCKGGNHGFRRANDGGLVQAYQCHGGHIGPPMPLCPGHIRELSQGPAAPGWSKDLRTSYGQIGGTKANEMCPACAFGRDVLGDEGKNLTALADELNQRMAQMQIFGLLSEFAKLEAQQKQVRARLDEYHERGIMHKCALKLVEVS